MGSAIAAAVRKLVRELKWEGGVKTGEERNSVFVKRRIN